MRYEADQKRRTVVFRRRPLHQFSKRKTLRLILEGFSVLRRRCVNLVLFGGTIENMALVEANGFALGEFALAAGGVAR